MLIQIECPFCNGTGNRDDGTPEVVYCEVCDTNGNLSFNEKQISFMAIICLNQHAFHDSTTPEVELNADLFGGNDSEIEGVEQC